MNVYRVSIDISESFAASSVWIFRGDQLPEVGQLIPVEVHLNEREPSDRAAVVYRVRVTRVDASHRTPIYAEELQHLGAPTEHT